ncbi:MAG: TetR/AcrR family transcriptional regulator [Actinobacteria bacterium]|nr:MAG: TetR/AcrR family transcriptional regulator [Actinomycetota bacterium]
MQTPDPSEVRDLKKRLCQRRSRQTERQIVAAASDLFATKGYSSVTMQDIADAARIGKATLYYHTPSKEDLGLLVVDAHLDRFIEQAGELASADLSAADRLRSLVSALMGWLAAGRELVEFIMPERGNPPPKTMRRLKRFRSEYLDVLEAIVRDGVAAGEFRRDVDPDVAVRAVLGMILHFHILTIRFQEAYKIDDVRDQIADLALGGLLVRSEPR